MNTSTEFEKQWATNYSTLPPLDKMSREEREKLKEYTWLVYQDGNKKNSSSSYYYGR
jgi:hypothetical protein